MVSQRDVDKLIKDLEYSDLKMLQASVQTRMGELEKEARDNAKVELEKRAQELGFDISTLYDLSGRKRQSRTSANGEDGRRASPKPKYRDPNSDSTWSGRGLKPKWMNAYLAKSKSNKVEDCIIEKQ